MKNIQYIALDESSQKALDMTNISKISEKINISVKELSKRCVTGYQQVVIISKVDKATTDILIDTLENTAHPILILPKEAKITPVLEKLLKSNIVLIDVEIDSLLSLSFSKIINNLDNLLLSENEEDITLDENEIFYILKAHSINSLYELQGNSVQEAVLKSLNIREKPSKAQGLICLFQIAPKSLLIDIADAFSILEHKVDEQAEILFSTRTDSRTTDKINLTLFMSRYIDFSPMVQQEIDEDDTYLTKTVTIIDRYADGTLTDIEANELAERNGIAVADLGRIYNITYTNQNALMLLLQNLRDKNVNNTQRIESISEAVIEDKIDVDVIEEMALTYKLPLDEILELIHQKREDIKECC